MDNLEDKIAESSMAFDAIWEKLKTMDPEFYGECEKRAHELNKQLKNSARIFTNQCGSYPANSEAMCSCNANNKTHYNEKCRYFSLEYVGNPGPVPSCNKDSILEAFNCSACEYNPDNQKVEKGKGCCGVCGYSASLHKRISEDARTQEQSNIFYEDGLCCVRCKPDIFEVSSDEFCDFFARKGVKCTE